MCRYARVVSMLRSTLPLRAPEMRQPSLAASAVSANASAVMQATSPFTVSALEATFQPPSICWKVTVALTSSRMGGVPARHRTSDSRQSGPPAARPALPRPANG